MELILLQIGGDGIWSLVFPLAIMGVFYFFFIRPQMTKQKEQDTFSTSIAKGDKVVTSSGILGTVNKIEDQIITLQVDTKTFIRVTRTAISKELSESIYAADAKSE